MTHCGYCNKEAHSIRTCKIAGPKFNQQRTEERKARESGVPKRVKVPHTLESFYDVDARVFSGVPAEEKRAWLKGIQLSLVRSVPFVLSDSQHRLLIGQGASV